MASQKDIWKYYDRWRLHLTGKRKVNKAVKDADGKIVAEYIKRGKPIAWDVEVTPENIKIARKIFSE